MSDLLSTSKLGDVDSLVQILVEGENSVNVVDEDGRSGLYWAASYDHHVVCQHLLQAGIQADMVTRWGSTALHAACERGHLRCVHLLIQWGSDVNYQNDNGDTPLHLSAYRGHLEIARLLLKSGADVNVTNVKSKTPIEEAESHGHHKILRAIADHLTAEIRVEQSGFSFRASRIPKTILLEKSQLPPPPRPAHPLPPSGVQSRRDAPPPPHNTGGCQSLVPSKSPIDTRNLNINVLDATNLALSTKSPKTMKELQQTDIHLKPERQQCENECVFDSNTQKHDDSISGSMSIDKRTAIVQPLLRTVDSNKQDPSTQHPTIEVPKRIAELESLVCDLQAKLVIEKQKVENLKRANSILAERSQESSVLVTQIQRSHQVIQRYQSSIKLLQEQIYRLQVEKQEAFAYTQSLEREVYLLKREKECDKRFHDNGFLFYHESPEHLNHHPDFPSIDRTSWPTIRARGVSNTALLGDKSKNITKLNKPVTTLQEQIVPNIKHVETLSNNYLNEKPISPHNLYLTVRPTFQNADLEFMKTLSNDLRTSLKDTVIQPRRPLEAVPGREWTMGVDYTLAADDPINHTSRGQRDGSCSLVYRITHNNRDYILKMMINLINLIYRSHGDGQSLPEHLHKEFAAEYHIPLCLPRHRNIVQILHYYNGSTKDFRRHLPLIIPEELDVDVDMATQTTFMVMDEYPTTLQTFIKTRKHVHPQPPYGIPTQYFSLCIYQVLSAISHLHNNHTIHRDIKAENVFLDSRLRVVLADFGFARKLRNPNGSPVELVAKEQIVAGNNGAWAPELIRARRADNDIFTSRTLEELYDKTDVFAVGVMFYSILRHDENQYFPQCSVDLPHYMEYEIPELGKCFDGGIRDVLRQCVLDLPQERISAHEALCRVGCLLFGPRLDEVFSREDCRIWLQTRMMENVVNATPQHTKDPEDSPLTVEESVSRVTEELQLDFLSTTTSFDLWNAYCKMKQYIHR